MPFSHPALPKGVDAIRILEIEPGDYSKQIVGTLTAVLFSDKPKYVALSYTWSDSYPENAELPVSIVDDPEPEVSSQDACLHQSKSILTESTKDRTSSSASQTTTRSHSPITLNGQPFNIKHNLHLALLHLRSPTHSLTIWIDAICINQADIEERNHQVSIMAFIYTRATKVVSWLGTKYYSPMTGLFRTMSLEWKAGYTQHFAASLVEGGRMHFSPAPDQSTFAHIIKSTYWERLWIVQEICLPRLLVFAYGSSIWTFEDFTKYRATMLTHWGQGNDVAAFRLLEIRDQRHTDRMRLENLIETFARSNCSDPKDKVYGLLGCANDVQPIKGQDESSDSPKRIWFLSLKSFPLLQPRMGSIDVNYRRSYYDIWTDVIRSVYFQARVFEQNVELQSRVLEYNDQRGFPKSMERSVSIVRTAGIVQAALGQKVEMEVLQNENSTVHEPPMVIAIGYIAGEILHLGPDYTSLVGSSSATQDWIRCWADHYEKENQLKTLRQTNEEYMAQILDYKASDLSRIHSIWNPYVEAGRYTQVHSDPLPDHSDEYVVMLRSQPMGDQSPRICLGTGLTMGLVPPSAARNDIIVRFWNCNAAIIMRPIKGHPIRSKNRTESLSYMLVGRADIAEIVQPEPSSHVVSLWTIQDLPGSKGNSEKSGPVHVKLDRRTLQMITAHIATDRKQTGLLSLE